MKILFLTGFMGTGKSTVGPEVAKQLGYKFCDMDHEIETRTGQQISTIFRDEGEESFRDLETALIRELIKQKELVVATGGGVVLRPENRRLMRTGGQIFCLTSSPESIFFWIKGNNTRPLLQAPDPVAVIRRMMAERAPYYQDTDFTIPTGEPEAFDLDALTKQIIQYYRQENA